VTTECLRLFIPTMPPSVDVVTTDCIHGHQYNFRCICDRYWLGVDCDWPDCGPHGQIDSSTRQCQCSPHFGGAFCRECIDSDHWGVDCSLRTLIGVDQSTAIASRSALMHGICARLLLIALLIALACAVAVIVCRSMSIRHKRVIVVQSTPPPDYITALADTPPTYQIAID